MLWGALNSNSLTLKMFKIHACFLFVRTFLRNKAVFNNNLLFHLETKVFPCKRSQSLKHTLFLYELNFLTSFQICVEASCTRASMEHLHHPLLHFLELSPKNSGRAAFPHFTFQ